MAVASAYLLPSGHAHEGDEVNDDIEKSLEKGDDGYTNRSNKAACSYSHMLPCAVYYKCGTGTGTGTGTSTSPTSGPTVSPTDRRAATTANTFNPTRPSLSSVLPQHLADSATSGPGAGAGAAVQSVDKPRAVVALIGLVLMVTTSASDITTILTAALLLVP